MNRLVALTGAMGFIGGNLASSLIARGWRVRALARRRPPAGAPSVDWVSGDLASPPALRELVEGASCVVHCAGVVRGATWREFERTNVLGTLALVEASRESESSPRFLFLSSLAAREADLSWYASSKRQAEDGLRAKAGEMRWTVFRPTAVYGSGDVELRPVFSALRKGVLPVLGPPEARLTFLHVDDLVRSIVLWVERSVPPQGIFPLHDGTPDGYGWRRIAEIAEEVWDRPVRRLPIPGALLFALGGLNVGLARMMGYSPMLTPGKVREIRYPDWRCDNGPLSAALGWEPEVDLAAGLRRMEPAL